MGVVLMTVSAAGVVSKPATGQEGSPDPTTKCQPTTPTSAADYQAAFDDRVSPWVGADLNDVIADGPNRALWLFGDTIVGNVQPDGSIAPGWGFVNNSLVVQSGACFSFQVAGTSRAPEEWIASPHPSGYWVGGAVATADTIEVVLQKVSLVDNGGGVVAFNFFISGIDIATLRRSDLAVESIVPVPMLQSDVPNTVIPYGAGLTAVGRFAYLYGFSKLNQMVARVPLNRMTDFTAWEYWRGGGGVGAKPSQPREWTKDPNQATPMTVQPFTPGKQPFAPLEVVKYGRGYLAVAKGTDFPDPANPVANTTVFAWSSRNPVGPWTLVGPIATTPISNNEFTYGAELIDTLGAGLLVTWSRNAPIEDVLVDSTIYEPVFAPPSNLPSPSTLFPSRKS